MKTRMSIVANTFVKQFTLERKGEQWLGDRHTYDHQSLLAKGSIRCWVEGKEASVFHAPYILVIAAEVVHNFEALEDGVEMFCIHALRKQDGTDDIFLPEDKPTLNQSVPLSIRGDEESKGIFKWLKYVRKIILRF